MPEDRRLTEKQAARRQRVIRAALDLASAGGYDGVQMREVADRADVALGTVYHYFTSKDHLLAEALNEWVETLAASVERHPPAGDTTLGRVLDLLRRSTGRMEEFPALTAALIGGFVAEGEQVAACQERLHATFSEMMGHAFDDGFPVARRDHVIRTLEHVWFSALLGWKNQWIPFERAISDLEDAAALLLVEE